LTVTTDIRSYDGKIGIAVIGLGKIIPAIGDLHGGHTGPNNILIGVLKAIGEVRSRTRIRDECAWLRNKTIGTIYLLYSRCVAIDQVGTKLAVYIDNPFSQVRGVHDLIEAL
jgi:hypothetical protein